MTRVLPVLIAIGLMVYALADLSASDDEQRGGIPRWLWTLLIVLLPFFGAVAWILIKQSHRRADGGTAPGRPNRPTPGGPNRRRPRPGPTAPDDDPEFLWRLEQQQRRNRSQQSTDGDDQPSTNGQ